MRGLDIGVASRPLPGFTMNGDHWVVEETSSGALVAVFDGIGHGPEAAEASELAAKCLRENARFSMDMFYALCHGLLVRTRGIVAATASIDVEGNKLRYTGVGNIEGSLCVDGVSQDLIWRYGIIGSGMETKIDIREAEFAPGALLVMHSDGISNKFRLAEYYGLSDQPAQFIADVLMRDWGRNNDDATILVVRREESDG